MTTIDEQILATEEEIRKTPYHKGTEHHIGKLRARIARLKDKQFEQAKKGGSKIGYAVKKQGDATLVLVGPPSSGKSTLINKLTNAQSKVAPYAFTTVSVIPGIMEFKDAKIQILDVPGLIEGAEEGKGRGREVLSVIRSSDLLIIMTDIQRLNALESIKKALERNGIRVNKEKPKVSVEKKLKGGIVVHSNIKQPFSKETIVEVASEMGIKNAEIKIDNRLDSINDLIDAFMKNRVYIPAIFVVNKADLAKNEIRENLLYISALTNQNLDVLKERIWEKLGFVRVFLVKPDEEPGFENPIIMRSSDTLLDLAAKLGSDFLARKKGAKIWGSHAKFPGQEVSLSTKVKEGMQIRFI